MTRRAERVSNLIRQEVSELLQEQVNDPRLRSLISVTKVSTSADLRNAKIYISCLDENANKEDILQGFKAASSFFRRELAHRLTLRYVPSLSFYFDDSIEFGANMIQLIDQISFDGNENEHKRNC
ncbi:30S ribosome-binding factor RbfA [Chloroflexota bacterium]